MKKPKSVGQWIALAWGAFCGAFLQYHWDLWPNILALTFVAFWVSSWLDEWLEGR